MSIPFKGISLHVTVTIDPTNQDVFFAALWPAFKLVSAEPECTFFEVYQSSENPGIISWVENWTKDVQWLLQVQLKKEYKRHILRPLSQCFSCHDK